MNLSDLQRKDIVNIYNGKKLGRIVDAELDNTGVLIKFFIERKKFWRLFSFKEDFSITFSQIKKIGEDVILVELIDNDLN